MMFEQECTPRSPRRQLPRRGFLAAGVASGAALVFGRVSDAATPAVIVTAASAPTASSALLRIRANAAVRTFIEYGYSASALTAKTVTQTLAKGASRTVALDGLRSGVTVYYRARYAIGTARTFAALPVAQFQTKAAASGFAFAIQADPHMDENSTAEVYAATLDHIAAAAPAFLMDLGDIFMVDKLQNKSEANIRARFELMKQYYARLGTVPLRITLGNHDGELGYSAFNTKKYRAEYFPEQTGELAYYSFTGPDALFIVLDPFTYTTSSPKADGWAWTLGKTQYDWLVRTLESSSATHKIVFIHHLLVGDAASRGGVEVAGLNEWGGNNVDGTYGFDMQRPGWGKPVHQLLLEHGVGFVFKGHDHLYVQQELDGIVYQTLPQPSHAGDKLNSTIEYGYTSGKALGGSGYLLVTLRAAAAQVDFVKYDGSVVDSYVRSV